MSAAASGGANGGMSSGMSSGTSGATGGGTVTLRYWAAAKEAAGTAEERFGGPAPVPGTLAELLDAARAAHPDDGRFASVLSRCSFLVDGAPAGTRSHPSVALRPGAVVEALPPFAGG